MPKTKTLAVRRIRLLSAGTMAGLVGAFLGLLTAIPISLFAILGAGASQVSDFGASIGIPSVLLGVGSLLGLPLAYGLVAFVWGLLHALVYNVVASFTGGLVLEID